MVLFFTLKKVFCFCFSRAPLTQNRFTILYILEIRVPLIPPVNFLKRFRQRVGTQFRSLCFFSRAPSTQNHFTILYILEIRTPLIPPVNFLRRFRQEVGTQFRTFCCCHSHLQSKIVSRLDIFWRSGFRLYLLLIF